ncbi:MAG: type II toxin-antitoxin system Phd/YefM family antitoxin [Terriglobales bacterium]
MEITITATEANRKFSEMLRGVRQGKRYVITSHGERLAELRRITPALSEEDLARKRRARELLLRRLESQTPLNLPHISRDEMYE